MRFALSATLMLLSLLCTAAHACCVWDNDLLEDELLPWPDALSIMSGRIERQPPEWHEARLRKAMRLELDGSRERNLLVAAAALDQLNRQHEALELLLPLLDEPIDNTDRTRLHAALSQLYMHLWWRKDPRNAPAFLLAEAKRHNAGQPRGHYMDAIIDWAGQDERAAQDFMLPDMFKLRWAGNKIAIAGTTQLKDRNLDGAADLLLALLQLHPVWENYDTLYALSLVWAVDGRQPLAHMARTRAWQLRDEGHGSRVPGFDELKDVRVVTLVRQPRENINKDLTPLDPRYRLALEDCMRGYRDYAVAWTQARQEHARRWLAGGNAADDPAMWADFKPPRTDLPQLPRPVLEPQTTDAPTQPDANAATTREANNEQPSTLLWPMLGAIVLLLGAGFFVNARVERNQPEETP